MGIVGLALEQAAAQENQEMQNEEIQWSSPSASRSALQYDDRTAEIQLRLKRINQYHGKVDGLKGPVTTEAIRSWENFNSNAVDGDISDDEMKTLIAMTESSQDAPADSETAVEEKAENNSGINEIAKGFYGLEQSSSGFQACMKFKESGNPYAIYLDRTFETNFKNFERLTSQHIRKRADCLGISEDKFNEIKYTTQEKYKKSDEAKMWSLGTSAVIAGQEDPMSFVNGCNTISQQCLLLHEKFRDQELTCDTPL